MIRKLGDEGGFSLVEMLVVMIIMGVIMGGIVKLFTAGINSNADLNRRYQAQQDGRLALDKMRREIHGACAISAPGTYNTAVSTVTLYYPADLCVAGSPGATVTYCTVSVPASGGVIAHYSLYRKTGANCTAPTPGRRRLPHRREHLRLSAAELARYDARQRHRRDRDD